jgi:hypothetical protein
MITFASRTWRTCGDATVSQCGVAGTTDSHGYRDVMISLTQLVRRVDRKLPLYGEDCNRGDLRR